MTVTSPLKQEQAQTNNTEWSLVACSSWLSGQTFAIKSKHNASVIKVGRGSHCDIIFPGTHLSREHVELKVENSHIFVRDLGSVNGTFINEVRVSEGVIRPGDKLRLDVYNFTVHGPVVEPVETTEAEFDIHATKLRSASPAKPAASSTDAKEDDKRWVTKPTSVGNRIEPANSEDKASLVPLYIIAGALVVAVGLLGAYLFLS